jgi:hypothetical protein
MFQFVKFNTRGASSTGIFRSAILAMNVACIGQGQRQFSRAFRAQKKLRMADAVFGYVGNQLFFQALYAQLHP